MKNLLVALLSFTGFILFVSPAVTALASAYNFNPIIPFLLFVAFALFSTMTRSQTRQRFGNAAGVEKEMWVDYIIKRFYKDNAFLNYAFNDDQYVLAGHVVHIPQQGVKPTVVKNRGNFPAVAVRRSDSDITYVLDTYTTDPTHILNAEKIEPSYNKLDDVWGDHAEAVNESVADDMIYKWASGLAGTSVIHTSGDIKGNAPAITAATLPGTTGNRLLAVHRDVRKLRLLFNTQNAPKTDRFGLLEENMADQIFESLSDNQARQFSEYADASTGVLGQLYGFNIMTRSSVAAASNADVLNAVGAANLATDSAASLFWQKNSVARALGTVKVYDDTDNPLYYGDILSTELRSGGRRRRADNIGIALLTQGTPQ